ncbi:MAG: hypothetical protein ACK5HR_04455 [Mycoplasmatales bacterium]
MALAIDCDPLVKEEGLINSRLFNIVEDNVWHLIERETIDEEIIDYFDQKNKKINYLEFEKLKAINYNFTDYQVIELAKDNYQIRLECSKKYNLINKNEVVLNFATISVAHLNFIYDNLQIYELIEMLSFEDSLILKMRYGLTNYDNFNESIIIIKNILLDLKNKGFWVVSKTIMLTLTRTKITQKKLDIIEQQVMKVQKKYLDYIQNFKENKSVIKEKIAQEKFKINKMLVKEIEELLKKNITLQRIKKEYGLDHKFTLEEAGKALDFTRERIRQIQLRSEIKILSWINGNFRGNYNYIFSFNFHNKFLNEEFDISNLILNNSQKFIPNFKVSAIKDIFSEEQFFKQFSQDFKEIEKRYYLVNNYILVNKNWVQKKRKSVISFLIKNLTNEPYTLEDIGQEYNGYLKKCQLNKIILKEKKDYRAFGTTLERCGIVKSLKHYRKPKYNFGEKFKRFIDELIDQQEDFFSTKIIYDKHRLIMQEFDILDYYELHHIMKKNAKNFKNKLIFERMPHVTKKLKLEQFLEYELSISNYKNIDLFLNNIESRTGIAISTLKGSYRETIDKYYFLNEKIKNTKVKTNDLTYLKQKYLRNVYTKEEIIKDIKKYGNQVFLQLNFKFSGNWMFKNNFESVREVLFSQCNEVGITKFTKLSKITKESSYFKGCISQYRANLSLIKIAENTYLKVSEDLKAEIELLMSKLRKKINKLKIVTLWEFKKMVNSKKYPIISKYNFEDEFFKNISCSNTTIRYHSGLLYDQSINTLEIVQQYFQVNPQIDFIDMKKFKLKMLKMRGWEIPESFIKKIKQDNIIYYSKTLDVIFATKDKFILYLQNKES